MCPCNHQDQIYKVICDTTALTVQKHENTLTDTQNNVLYDANVFACVNMDNMNGHHFVVYFILAWAFLIKAFCIKAMIQVLKKR